ncbi:MAG: hypothetical protein NT029_17895 [Armatimonadetes bacterium]|nr:hypothetical protein [Armatimonadota bacterium]
MILRQPHWCYLPRAFGELVVKVFVGLVIDVVLDAALDWHLLVSGYMLAFALADATDSRVVVIRQDGVSVAVRRLLRGTIERLELQIPAQAIDVLTLRAENGRSALIVWTRSGGQHRFPLLGAAPDVERNAALIRAYFTIQHDDAPG